MHAHPKLLAQVTNALVVVSSVMGMDALSHPARNLSFSRILHDLHGDLHPIKGIRRTFPRTRERGSLLVLAGHGNRDMLETGEFVVSRIETSPARSGNIDLGPGMGSAMLAFAHYDIARDQSRPKT